MRESRHEPPLESLAANVLTLAAVLAVAGLLVVGVRRLTIPLRRRLERRLHATLTAHFVLITALAILLAQIMPAGLLALGVHLALPAEMEAGLYARRVAAALARQAPEERREAATRLFDWLTSEAMPHPAPQTLEDGLFYTFRLPAGLTGELRGLVWLSPEGEVRVSSSTLPPDLRPDTAAAERAVFASAVSGEENVVANSFSALTAAGVVYHVGAAPVKDATGRVLGVVVVWIQAGALLGTTAAFYTPLITFAMFALILGATGAIVLLPASLVAALLGRDMARHIVGPLQALDTAARAMAEGDLGRRAQVESPNELGDLARQFNHMADRLQAALAALQDERDQVARLARAQRDLVANVSHDLRTPLAALQVYLESLEGHPDRLPEYLPILHDETARLTRLVDDLFALARLDAHELELDLGQVHLPSLGHKMVTDFAPLAWSNRRVVLETDLPDGLPPVRADALRVEQILSNLLTNALRYTPEGGVITVAARDLGRAGVEVRVTDTGAGIAPEDLPHVFERFYRADPARSGGGAGLGLAIVKSLVEAQGGQVGVASAPGEGASFWFTLPQVD